MSVPVPVPVPVPVMVLLPCKSSRFVCLVCCRAVEKPEKQGSYGYAPLPRQDLREAGLQALTPPAPPGTGTGTTRRHRQRGLLQVPQRLRGYGCKQRGQLQPAIVDVDRQPVENYHELWRRVE
jgi:hypothetical protein